MRRGLVFNTIIFLGCLGLLGCDDEPKPENYEYDIDHTVNIVGGPRCDGAINSEFNFCKTDEVCRCLNADVDEDDEHTFGDTSYIAPEKVTYSEVEPEEGAYKKKTGCETALVCVKNECLNLNQAYCSDNCVDPLSNTKFCGAKGYCTESKAGSENYKGVQCKAGEVCSAGKCASSCTSGLSLCGSVCVNLKEDPGNCGKCGTKCPGGNTCVNGKCSASCLSGQTLCGNACVTLSTDANNCGKCGNKCKTGEACVNGACSASCLSGQTLCGNACVTLASDSNNCGACGTACPSGEACVAGKCVINCQDGLTECSGVCANRNTDKDNCGKCGTKCSENAQICVDGACTCPTGYTLCADEGCVDLAATHRSECAKCIDNSWGDCDSNWKTGCETNLMTSNSSCETCGHECSAGTFCSNGVCSATCGSGLTKCTVSGADGCYNLLNDALHCGECNKPCPEKDNAVASCSEAACVYTCKAGYTNCGTSSEPNCLDLNINSDNCGTCQNKCGSLPNVSEGTCQGGVCQVSCKDGFADCNKQSADGCETNLKTDSRNCSACGTSCKSGEMCSEGSCGASCGGGLVGCPENKPTYCANTKLDPENCSACGKKCASTDPNATPICNEGKCNYICKSGYTNCGSDTEPKCIKVTGEGATDANNCGYCGYKCSEFLKGADPNSITCNKGVCVFEKCKPNYASCDGSDANGCEVDAQSDQTHCGASDKCSTDVTKGENCTGGRVCNEGACVCAIAGEVFCDGRCIDPKTDANYCGASGNCSGNNAGATCTGGQICTDSKCQCQSGLTYCKINNDYICVDPQTSKQYCGCTASSAGTACGNDQYCGGGACQTASCGSSQCYVNGCVTNTNDKGCGANCNDCTSAGGSGLHSVNGVCNSVQCVATDCETGYCAKDGVCASNTLATSCGKECIDCTDTGRICLNGNCICPDNKVYCKTGNNTFKCIDPSNDNEYCGCSNNSPGMNCNSIPHATVAACKNNKCNVACENGYSPCEKGCCSD